MKKIAKKSKKALSVFLSVLLIMITMAPALAFADEKNYIIENAYDPIYGARPLKRYIQKHVETLAAKLILADKVHEKDTILIDVGTEELVATTVKA